MKILSAQQMREADSFTIKNRPISSIDLMEVAGDRCYEWLLKYTDKSKKHFVICGTGNNGGDGLVIARMLFKIKIPVEVIILDSQSHAIDFEKNLEQLKSLSIQILILKEDEQIPSFKNAILIDAIFGTGLTRPVSGWIGVCIDSMNNSGCEIISIDLPSGLFADSHSEGKIIKARYTLTFQSPKLAFFFPENEKYVGEFHILDIGLDQEFMEYVDSKKEVLEKDQVKKILKPRGKFTHKGNYGHALLISGSKGKIGASVLAARACLRSGAGLLTVHVPQCGYEILQSTIPEAMTEADKNENEISESCDIEKYSSIAIGPGIGTSAITIKMFEEILDKSQRPIILDADALNILSMKKELLKKVPALSILTPHPKEFSRLAGDSSNDFERHERQIQFSMENNVIVILKGAYTCISFPGGQVSFNSTGNPGMAKGGSGDVLTGILLSLTAQGYSFEEAAILGVYIHGLAGDKAAKKKGVYSMIATDLIEALPKAFLSLMD
jgi:hydroxyethylthiazole kinase-like uncharacterized protein yjeF